MIKNKFKRVVLDLGYVVRDGDEEMERHAMTSLYEVFAHGVNLHELLSLVM